MHCVRCPTWLQRNHKAQSGNLGLAESLLLSHLAQEDPEKEQLFE